MRRSCVDQTLLLLLLLLPLCAGVISPGTQWHPEKPTSEFGMPEVPHTLDAVRVGLHLANYLVDTGNS
jgi:hypothetical protein